MRGTRLGQWVVLVGALCALAISSAVWAEQASVPTTIQLHWRTSAVSVSGYVDSLTASINGAIGTTGTIDTTFSISTADWDWGLLLRAGGATAVGAGRLYIAGTNTSSDTIFYQIQTSPDNSNWSTTSTFIGGLIGTSGDAALSGPFLTDSDVLGTGGTGTIAQAKYLRFIFRADGNTGSKIVSAKAYLSYLKRPITQ